MTLTSELDDATPIPSPVSCGSLNEEPSPINGDGIRLELARTTYLRVGLDDDAILDPHIDQDCLMDMEMIADRDFGEGTSAVDFSEIPVVSVESVDATQRDEEQTENDAAITKKLHLSSSSSSDTLTKGKAATLSLRDYLMVVATFFIALIAKGNSAGLSVLAVEWIEQFENSRALILYVPALNFAFTSAAGVIDGLLINRYGIFRVILLGCFLQVFCMLGSSFSTNAITLVIVLGLLAGLGNCFLFVNAFIFVGVYFGDAAKPMIAFLSVAGPIGGLIFPNLIAIFIEHYSWRGSMFILAGMNLQVVPLAVFLMFAQRDRTKKQTSYDAAKKRSPEPAPPSATTPTRSPLSSSSSSSKLLDVSVFENFPFVMYLFSVGFTVAGVNSVFSMLPDILCEKGLNLKSAAQLFALYYILSAVPRILIGFAMKYTNVNFIHIYITMASLFGLTMALLNLAESYIMLVVFCVLLAMWMGCPAGLYSIGILELVGPHKHSSGQSIVETCYGLTTALFGFFAGLLVQHTNSYGLPFYIYGTSIVVINIVLLVTISAQDLRVKLGFSKLPSK